ncbi:MAG: hypothetical protein Q7U48_13740 [Hydrogenophaga sp.]|nr:hypothetical protein [Hydrogenophaga sp.]
MSTTPAPKSLYQRLVDAGIELDHWQSDLYFPATEQTRQIVADCLADGSVINRPQIFCSAIDGQPTFDAPFAYEPFWARRSA